jgi:hypothetical protein
MVREKSGETETQNTKKSPNAAFFEKIPSKPLAKTEKTRYSLTA